MLLSDQEIYSTGRRQCHIPVFQQIFMDQVSWGATWLLEWSELFQGNSFESENILPACTQCLAKWNIQNTFLAERTQHNPHHTQLHVEQSHHSHPVWLHVVCSSSWSIHVSDKSFYAQEGNPIDLLILPPFGLGPGHKKQWQCLSPVCWLCTWNLCYRRLFTLRQYPELCGRLKNAKIKVYDKVVDCQWAQFTDINPEMTLFADKNTYDFDETMKHH